MTSEEQRKLTIGFSYALTLLKRGKKLTRTGWNGKNMFIYLVTEGKYPAKMDAVKGHYEDDLVPYRPYIAMKTADNTIVPWTASQTDLLENDWRLAE